MGPTKIKLAWLIELLIFSNWISRVDWWGPRFCEEKRLVGTTKTKLASKLAFMGALKLANEQINHANKMSK